MSESNVHTSLQTFILQTVLIPIEIMVCTKRGHLRTAWRKRLIVRPRQALLSSKSEDCNKNKGQRRKTDSGECAYRHRQTLTTVLPLLVLVLVLVLALFLFSSVALDNAA